MEDTDSTPPHHPTFSVHLSDSQIQEIVGTVLGDVQVLRIEQLQRGESFNNRIYFITVVINSTMKEFALKVSGHFFVGQKVENEVSCLVLLAQYCPEVPAPRVLAWSLDGVNLESNPSLQTQHGHEVMHTTSARIKGESGQTRSWILLERLPGKRLIIEENTATSKQYEDLMRQFASHVHAWRTKLPRRQAFGNIRMRRRDSNESAHSSFKLEVAGLILCGNVDQDCQIPTKRDYFLKIIEDAMQTVQTKPSFSENYRQQIRELLEKQDLRQKLETMAVFDHSIDLDAFFTHYDFSPRNMLVTADETNGHLQVSGILDFEFAGFFPVEEEFTNDAVGNEGDWPPQLYQIYLDELIRLGCKVPGIQSEPDASAKPLFSPQQWKEALLLTRLIDDIAPWRIAVGSYENQELTDKLSEAAVRVKTGIENLFDRQGC